MPTLKPLQLLALLALALLVPATTAAAQSASVPSKRTLYADGPTNRYLMDGEWLFRLDPGNTGIGDGLARSASRDGWAAVTVPNAWNAGDDSPASMAGTVGWYRKDFRLPSSSSRLDWVVRFESVNYRSQVWLNGHRVGSNRGAYLPFEVRLPSRYVKRGSANRLVIRVENVRKGFDLPPAGFSRTSVPTGGWWNYGGILREVYLKQVDQADFNSVQVLPDLPCRTCTATINFRVSVRNYDSASRRISLTGRFGTRRVRFATQGIGGERSDSFTASVRVPSPRLWSPRHPTLYDVRLDLRVGGRRVNSWVLKSGIRSVKVVEGRLTLNGLPVNIRGVGFHEDDKAMGFAIDNATRDKLMQDSIDLGATMMRTHYPVHPYLEELADRRGMLLWSEIPMYALKTQYLKSEIVRRTGARELRENVVTNGNHPSIIVWSVGNELSSRPGPVQGDYLKRAADQARELDPTRPIGYAVAGYPGAGCQPRYAPLDVLGINDYFGWYPGPNGQIADRTLLSDYLDSVRACYPTMAIMVTEFGAEANRSGPVEEKGTYEFQQDFINYQASVFATKPWLSGALYWALKEFRVRPSWDGGNPRPQSPIHQKGVVDYDGNRKPGFFDLQRHFRGVDQYPGDGSRARRG